MIYSSKYALLRPKSKFAIDFLGGGGDTEPVRRGANRENFGLAQKGAVDEIHCMV